MGQKYKIFINGKVLFLTQNPAEISEILSTENQYIIQPYKDKKRLAALFEILLGQINHSSMIIYHSNMEKLKEAIFSKFDYMEAAGGVVRNESGKILLIHRRGFWDLPKGKKEKNEKIKKTAIREVEEETGVGNLTVIDAVNYPNLTNECTYHCYPLDDAYILKASYWYNMETDFNGKLKPQADEDIEQAIWVDESELDDYYPMMYESIVDVLKASIVLHRKTMAARAETD